MRSAVFFLLIVGVSITACGDSGSPGVVESNASEQSDSEQNLPGGEFRVAKLEISGMTCHGCAAGVQDALKAVPGVTDAVVSQADRVARVTLQNDSPTGEKELRAAVDAKGYKVVGCTWDS